jgi:murein DD-endopeptidase MepM/ murein hydrolase activator NlpD
MAALYWPFNPVKINEGFGWSEWRQGFHDGIDIAATQGTPLVATATGRVLRYYSDKDGAGIDIRTDDGIIVRHWHLSRFDVSNGAYVQAGDQIGLTGGASGTWGAGFSTGAHLHWGTKVNGVWVDPQTLNPQHFGDSPTQPPRRKTMATMYYVQRNGKTTFALAGDGNGQAAWLETEQQDFANKLAAIHGSAIQLSPDTWDLWRSKYLSK